MPKIAEVIKYEGDNSTFIWKHPLEDFNSLTQLVVHESQEAIFMMNGQALDLFGPGRYTLKTQNIPLISKYINKTTGGKTPFHCEVYFINKTEQLAIKWGTDSKVQFMEPTYNFPISIGASGEMSLRAEDSRKLLVKLVGTENFLGQDNLVRYFRAFLMTKVKSYIAQVIREQKISIFEIDERINDMSAALLKMLKPDFEDYGISLERFFVTTIVKPDGESTYEKFKSLVVESNNTDIAPLLKRAFIFLEDGNWKDADEYCERVLDIDPENAQAYLGKLMAELKVHKQDDLAKLETSFDENDNYIKAARYADEKLRDKLNSYLDVIRYNADEKMYKISVDLMANAKTKEDFINLAESFELLENFKDSKELAAKCREKAEEARKESIYLNAIKFYNSDSVAKVKKSIEEYNKIANYKDVDNRILLSEEKIKQLNSIANEKQIAYSKKRKRKFTIVLSIITVIIVGIILAFVITNVNKSNNYNSAIQMLESGQYQEAYDLFRELGDYKDSEKQMDNAKIEAQISNLKNINVGDVIKFGIIGDEDIEWQVLDKKDNEIFVITKYIYSCDTYDGCDWESSFIRKKLNTDVGYSDDGFYYYFYFNEDAKTMIQTTNVIYKDENGTEKNTADKLFLLSVDEYNKYFKNPSEAKCTPSKNNPSKNGILDHWDCWMLRSPTSGLSREVECVSGSGEVLNSSDIYDEYYVGVRPAMWINLEK